MDEKINEYIRQELTRGTSLKEIKKLLLKAGHEKKVVEEYIRSFTGKSAFNHLHLIEAILALGVIVFFIFFFFDGSDKQDVTTYLTTEEDLESGSDLFNEALIGNDPDTCEDIGNEELREQCLEMFYPVEETCDQKCQDKNRFNDALIEKNPSLCAEISDKSLNEQCYMMLEVRGDE